MQNTGGEWQRQRLEREIGLNLDKPFVIPCELEFVGNRKY
jgi:hypothetical protein